MVTQLRVSMMEPSKDNSPAKINDQAQDKGQHIDFATSIDNNSVAVKAAIELGQDSVLNSTLLSFLSQKNEKGMNSPAKNSTSADPVTLE